MSFHYGLWSLKAESKQLMLWVQYILKDLSLFFFFQPTSPKFGKADSYEKLEKLGEGSYATVYKGKSK